jgi:hypothetical protein
MRPAELPSSPEPAQPTAQKITDRIAATARSIAAAQLPSGAIAWPDGHVDPWDHVECAMALSAGSLADPARRAYQWLRGTQREDGSWPRTTVGATVTDPAAETHHAAYVAVGIWHEYLVTGDRGFARQMWPTVRRAIDWVLGLQAPRGEVAWERDASGRPGDFALLSGCSSILHGLRCAIALADMAGEPQPGWELAAVQLGHVLACHPEAFADKSRFAMDWYYPVLGGALRGAAAGRRLAAGWDAFVVPGLGVRCVSDQPWMTVAETCELVLALDACGLREQAAELFGTVHRLRHDDGSYWTGWQFRNAQYFPAERSSWTAAAVILATDALTGFSPGASIFRDAPAPRYPPDTRSPARAALDGADGCPPADPEACGCARPQPTPWPARSSTV